MQQTNEWYEARLGKVTASRVADVMSKTKSGYSASRKNYMMELLCQRLTKEREEGFTSSAMQRGVDLEPIARSAYEVKSGLLITEVGFIDHPEIIGFGASPDGLAGNEGLIEIKCPNTAQHVEFIRTNKPDTKYQWQMLAQMVCTGRKWCDFVSFDDRMPEPLQMAVVRFNYDEEKAAQMIEEISTFLDELGALEIAMLEKIMEAA